MADTEDGKIALAEYVVMCTLSPPYQVSKHRKIMCRVLGCEWHIHKTIEFIVYEYCKRCGSKRIRRADISCQPIDTSFLHMDTEVYT